MRIKLLFLTFAAAALFILTACSIQTEKSADGSEDKNVDIKTPVGNLHVGKDVDARDAGLPIYPGAKLKPKKDGDDSSANLSLLTSAFGLKVVAAQYTSDDSQDKIATYYRKELKKYGNVIDCHTDKHGSGVDVHSDKKDDDHAGPVTCDSPNTGKVLELKAGTEDNQHVVSIEPQDKGTDFSLVFVRLRGKQGDI